MRLLMSASMVDVLNSQRSLESKEKQLRRIQNQLCEYVTGIQLKLVRGFDRLVQFVLLTNKYEWNRCVFDASAYNICM